MEVRYSQPASATMGNTGKVIRARCVSIGQAT